MNDLELSLISKTLKTKEIYPLLNVDIGKCIRNYSDVWEFIVSYHSRYRQVPPGDVVQKKFPEVEPVDVDDVSLDYLINEIQTDHIKQEAESFLIDTVRILREGDPRDALTFASSKLATLMHQTQTVKDIDLAADFWQRVNSLKERVERASENGEVLGIPTTIPPIDYIFGGMQKGDFIILMGWTGSAKTWLATYLAIQAWKQGYTPLYFSLEMDDAQFGYRFDTLIAGGKFSNISLMNARGVKVSEYESWAKQEFADKHPFHLITNETAEEVNQLVVQSKIEQYRPDVVFIDYHHLMDDARKGKNETEKVKNIGRDLKKIAGRYAVPIVDIASVTMEDGHGERAPRLEEIGWARSLAFDSDLTLSLFKEGQVLNVQSVKTRRGNPFAFSMSWDFDNGIISLHDWDD